MTTNNSVNTGLSGQTGTGSFAGSDQPVFTTNISTPNLRFTANTISATNVGGSINFQVSTTGLYNFNATASNAATLILFENTANGVKFTGLKAAETVTTSTTFILPVADGSANSLLYTNGSAQLGFSSSTFPVTAGAAGTILRSDGTNWVASTATFANTYSASTLLYSNGANTVTGLATANGATLVTGATGVPSWLANSGTTGQIYQSVNGLAPAWSTATYPSTAGTSGTLLRSNGTNIVNSTSTFADTYSASTLLYSNGANTVTGLATANSAVLVTSSSGVPAWSGTMTNGQLIIGSTGATPTTATLTAGSGVTITNGAASITIASAGGGGFTWTDVTGTSASMAVQNGYIADNAGLVTLTLPATAAIGSIVAVQGKGAGGWTIVLNSGQTIHMGSATTTTTTGSLSSTNQYNSIMLVCITANTTWAAFVGAQGNITVV
jgi:hypothetical protein